MFSLTCFTSSSNKDIKKKKEQIQQNRLTDSGNKLVAVKGEVGAGGWVK